MKALIAHRPKDVSIGDWEDPSPGEHDAVVAVASCGVCGTDRHIADGTYPAKYPNVLGHEIAGTVVSVGRGVDRVNEGDRVAVDPNIADHECTPVAAATFTFARTSALSGSPVQVAWHPRCWYRNRNSIEYRPRLPWMKRRLPSLCHASCMA